MPKNIVRTNPLARFADTFTFEMELDTAGVFGRETYENYIVRHADADRRSEALLRSLFYMDAILFLLLTGQEWSLPFTGTSIAQIPAVVEITVFLTSITFFMACAFFVSRQCYSAILDRFSNKIVDSDRIDPDFYSASRVHFDFYLKIFRAQLNLFGTDYLVSGSGFRAFSFLLYLITLLVLLILPSAHLVLMWSGGVEVWNSDWQQVFKWFFLLSVFAMNFSGLAMVVGLTINFNFVAPEPENKEANENSQTDAGKN